MEKSDIARLRLLSQRLAARRFEKPADVVRWMGAVQGQEYAQSLWAVGVRTRGATEADVEAAFEDRSIVRTWYMRGTLHFVPGEDLRWMVEMIAPRMRAFVNNVSNYQKLGLEEANFARSNEAIVRALEGGKRLMRPELAEALEAVGIGAEGIRLSLLLQRAQADGLICYATRKGKQVTFALVDEWLPASRRLEGDEALAEFTRRYFRGRGPATVQDYATWASIPLGVARAGLELVRSEFVSLEAEGSTYWLSPDVEHVEEIEEGEELPSAYLLFIYDEYIMGYKDRSAIMHPLLTGKAVTALDAFVTQPVVLHGVVAGRWQREVRKREVLISVETYEPLSEGDRRAVVEAAERYAGFLGVDARTNPFTSNLDTG